METVLVSLGGGLLQAFEPLNLFIVVVLPPGERKSPVFRRARRPLDEWEREVCMRVRPEYEAAAARVDVLSKRIENLKKKAAGDLELMD